MGWQGTPGPWEVLHFVFDGPPGPECGRFVECETTDGRSVNAGEWHERDNGFWELRVPVHGRPLMGALEEISERCPPLPDNFDQFATISDFGGNTGDYAQHVETLISSGTGDIARAALAKARGEQ